MAVYGKKIIVLPFKRDISTLAEEGISSEGDISLEGLRQVYFSFYRFFIAPSCHLYVCLIRKSYFKKMHTFSY